MRLDDSLNIVIPIYRDDDPEADPCAWVHSTPIARSVYDSNYRVLCRMMADMPAIGGNVSVAMNCLMDAAVRLDPKDGRRNAEALLNEIKRLSEISFAGPSGWDRMPLDDAEAQGKIDPEDMREVMSTVVFFSAAWHTQARRNRREFVELAARMSGAQTIASDASAFFASLPPLTKAATGPQQPPAPATGAPTAGESNPSPVVF